MPQKKYFALIDFAPFRAKQARAYFIRRALPCAIDKKGLQPWPDGCI